MLNTTGAHTRDLPQDEHANHYTINAVCGLLVFNTIFNNVSDILMEDTGRLKEI
jgi:hypothetical protein